MRINVFPGLSCANLLSTQQSAIVEMFYCCCQVAGGLRAFLLFSTDKRDDVVGGQRGKTRECEHACCGSHKDSVCMFMCI